MKPEIDEISGLPIRRDSPTPKGFWSYKAPDALDFESLPAGVINCDRDGWESLSPGMRREIVRDYWRRQPKGA